MSKMDWNSIEGIWRYPITISFAKRVGQLRQSFRTSRHRIHRIASTCSARATETVSSIPRSGATDLKPVPPSSSLELWKDISPTIGSFSSSLNDSTTCLVRWTYSFERGGPTLKRFIFHLGEIWR